MAAYIQVVLQEPVRFLGVSGDVVRVRPGYARNYLVPRGLAAYATNKNLAKLEHHKREALARAAKATAAAEATVKALAGRALTIYRKTGSENRIYGSVTTKDISEALETAGHKVDRRMISIEAAIKTVGTHDVTLKLTPDVEAIIKVDVMPAEGE